MPDLKYYSTLNTFGRTPDADSFIVLIDQSGANPGLVRALGSTLVQGVSSLNTGGTMISGAGSVGTPLTISGALDADDITNLSVSGAKIADDAIEATNFKAASTPDDTFLTLSSSDSTEFEWIEPFSVISSSLSLKPLIGYNLATGEIQLKTLVAGTNVSIVEGAEGLTIIGEAPAIPLPVISDLGSGTSFNIDVSTADLFKLNCTGTTTITATNFASNNGKPIILYVTPNGNSVTFGSGFSMGTRTDEPVDLAPGVGYFTTTTAGLWFVEYAQAAPAGSMFDPSGLGASLRFRLRAGFGLNAETGETRVSVTGGSDPTIETGALNGEDVYYFDASNPDILAFGNASTLFSVGTEIHAVFEYDDDTTGFSYSNVNQFMVGFPGSTTNPNSIFGGIYPSGVGSSSDRLDFTYNVPWSNGAGNTNNLTFDDLNCRDTDNDRSEYVILTLDITNGNGYENGTQLTNNSATSQNFGTPANANWSIGGNITTTASATSLNCNMRIAELLVTNLLSTTDREKIEGYFAWTYGLVGKLPGGHPYKSSPPPP